MRRLSVTIRGARIAFAGAVIGAVLSAAAVLGGGAEAEYFNHANAESAIVCSSAEQRALDFAHQHPAAAARMLADAPGGQLFESEDEVRQCPELQRHLGRDVRIEIANAPKAP